MAALRFGWHQNAFACSPGSHFPGTTLPLLAGKPERQGLGHCVLLCSLSGNGFVRPSHGAVWVFLSSDPSPGVAALSPAKARPPLDLAASLLPLDQHPWFLVAGAHRLWNY